MQMWKINVNVASLILIGLIAVTGTILWSSLATATGQCHPINTTQTTVADFANFTTTGEIKSGFLKGTTKFTGDASALTPITS